MIFKSLLILFISLWPELRLNISVADGCPSGWVRHENKCYHFSHDAESWIGAIHMCEFFGGKLVEIDSLSENNYLATTAKRNGIIYWIGLTDALEEDKWIWTNKKELVNTEYSNWYPGEPSNDGSDENCAQMRADGTWNDDHCNHPVHFICEADTSEEAIIG